MISLHFKIVDERQNRENVISNLMKIVAMTVLYKTWEFDIVL